MVVASIKLTTDENGSEEALVSSGEVADGTVEWRAAPSLQVEPGGSSCLADLVDLAGWPLLLPYVGVAVELAPTCACQSPTGN